MHRKTRLNLTDLNPLLTCSLCKGYLIDATTLMECLHSFCRSCLVRYLQTSQNCPKCDTLVHKTRPLHNASSSRLARSPGNLGVDRALQNIVYKLVPGLFKDEMKKRRDFYTQHPQAGTSSSSSPGDLEDRGEVGEEALVIYSDDEHMNLSLEYYLPCRRKLSSDKTPAEKDQTNGQRTNGDPTEKDPTSKGTTDDTIEKDPTSKGTNPTEKEPRNNKRSNGDLGDNDNIVDTRYLRCPAAVCVKHIKKFIRNKFDLKPSYQIEITHVDNEDDSLPDDYTLMDVAYIYTWRRNGPLPLVFRVFQSASKRQKTAHVTDHVSVPESVPENDGKTNGDAPPRRPATMTLPTLPTPPTPPVAVTMTPKQEHSKPAPSHPPQTVDDAVDGGKARDIANGPVHQTTVTSGPGITVQVTVERAISVDCDPVAVRHQVRNGCERALEEDGGGRRAPSIKSGAATTTTNNNEQPELIRENGEKTAEEFVVAVDAGSRKEGTLSLTELGPPKLTTAATEMTLAAAS